MLKLRFILVCLAALCIWHPSCSNAEPVSEQQAVTAVTAWLAAEPRPLGADLGNRVRHVVPFIDDSATVAFYVVYLEPSGFVVVAGDDLTDPILGFASDGVFDPSDTNPFGALVTNDVRGRLGGLRAKRDEESRAGRSFVPDGRFLAARHKWERLARDAGGSISIAALTSVSDERVSPLIQSKWNQSTVCGKAVYNYFTPPGAEGSASNYPSGCVATAMAQIMKFYEFPTEGIGVHSFSIQVDTVAQSASTRGGDGSGGPYDWASMVLNPGCAITDTQQRAIGALCYDAGVTVSMQYAAAGSGAFSTAAADALKGTFGYAKAVKGYNGGGNIGSGLNGMINPNLDAGWPVYLGITGSPGGHAIVCDGYGYSSSTLYHHLNMGWGGLSDAWYILPNIDAYYTFDTVTTCLYNIYVTGTGETVSGRVVDSQGHPIPGASVTATKTSTTYGPVTTNSRGIYAFTHLPSNRTNYTVSVQHPEYTFTSRSVSWGTSLDFSATSGDVWAIDFTGTGGPQASTFTINSGAAYATSQSVTLNNVCTGTPTQYMASESSGFAGASWLTYSTAPTFTLSAGSGSRTVYFKVRNAAGTESNVLSDTVILDTTPPTTPAVVDDGAFTTSGTQLHASWSSSDTVSGIADYQYAISNSKTEGGIISGGGWVSVAVQTQQTRTGLSLTYGQVYYVLVKVRNGAGLWSSVGVSDGIVRVQNTPASIGAAKALGDTATTGLSGKTVTAMFGTYFYAQEPRGSAGIRVEPIDMPPGLTLGQTVDIGGTLQTTVNERAVRQATVTTGISGTAKALSLTNESVTGPAWQYNPVTHTGQNGVAGAVGTNNVGLLVRTWGQITQVGAGYIYVKDGSLTTSQQSIVVRVNCDPTGYQTGYYVSVTGISSLFDNAGSLQRLIQTRNASDVVRLH